MSALRLALGALAGNRFAAVVGALALLATAGPAAAETPAACEPCEGLTPVGDAWRVRVEPGRETYDGKGDRPARVTAFRVDGAQCCPARTKDDYPGVYAIGVDPARHRVLLEGHDARWSAIATNGIWSWDVETGLVEVVAQRLWSEVPCPGRPLRIAAIVQADRPQTDRPQTAGSPGADGPRPDPYAGTFRLVVLDLAAPGGPRTWPVAARRSLRELDASFDPERFAALYHWNDACDRLSYALSPKGKPLSYRVPTGPAASPAAPPRR